MRADISIIDCNIAGSKRKYTLCYSGKTPTRSEFCEIANHLFAENTGFDIADIWYGPSTIEVNITNTDNNYPKVPSFIPNINLKNSLSENRNCCLIEAGDKIIAMKGIGRTEGIVINKNPLTIRTAENKDITIDADSVVSIIDVKPCWTEAVKEGDIIDINTEEGVVTALVSSVNPIVSYINGKPFKVSAKHIIAITSSSERSKENIEKQERLDRCEKKILNKLKADSREVFYRVYRKDFNDIEGMIAIAPEKNAKASINVETVSIHDVDGKEIDTYSSPSVGTIDISINVNFLPISKYARLDMSLNSDDLINLFKEGDLSLSDIYFPNGFVFTGKIGAVAYPYDNMAVNFYLYSKKHNKAIAKYELFSPFIDRVFTMTFKPKSEIAKKLEKETW